VRDKLAVVYKICCSCIVKRLVDQEGQLEIDSLSDWKPVELPQHRCDVVTSTEGRTGGSAWLCRDRPSEVGSGACSFSDGTGMSFVIFDIRAL